MDKSTKIMAFIAAGNRDPRKWNDPNRFDITRSAAQHLSLGSGVHNCIGQVIARLEFDAVLSPFIEKVAKFRMIEPPKWHDNNVLRTLDRLQIEVELV